MTLEELLKEVGEPFGYIIPHYADYPNVFFKHPLPKGYSALMARTKLYTSDQVAAAILKATKPLEEKLSWLDYTEKMNKALGAEIEELTAQFAAEQEEIRSRDDFISMLQETHKDQLAKAEQRVAEWQPIETAPKDGRELILLLTPYNWPQVAYSNTWWQGGFSVENKPTHWMPLPTPPKRNMEGV